MRPVPSNAAPRWRSCAARSNRRATACCAISPRRPATCASSSTCARRCWTFIAKRADAADLAPLDDDLRAFLASRLDLGLLELRRLTWADSAALLERLARSEAVHAVRGWFDLKDRLDDDRRVYAFFHPALPGNAARLHRGRADRRSAGVDPFDPEQGCAARRRRRGAIGDVLLDLELRARAERRSRSATR